MNLYKAFQQWKSRPSDERFWDLDEMYEITKGYTDSSIESFVNFHELEVLGSGDGNEIIVKGKLGIEASFSNHAFDQFAARVKAPAGYLRQLPAHLAAANLDWGVKNTRGEDDRARMLLYRGGDALVARCFTGENYARVWNHAIVTELAFLEGWKVPPARPQNVGEERIRKATEQDVLRASKLGGLGVKVGDPIGPAGLYASDRDMFAFLVCEDALVETKSGPLARGFFVWNSEVGDRSFGLKAFLYDAVCGNHIVWGAKELFELRIRHVGQARQRALGGVEVELRQYAESSVSGLEQQIEKARRYEIAGSAEEVVISVLAFAKRKKLTTITESAVLEAYQEAEHEPRYGSPRSAWAVSQGLTVVSQRSVWANRRAQMDREAGKILEMAF